MRRSEQAIHGMSVVYQARTRHFTRIQPPTPQRKRLRLSKSDCASRAYVQRAVPFSRAQCVHGQACTKPNQQSWQALAHPTYALTQTQHNHAPAKLATHSYII